MEHDDDEGALLEEAEAVRDARSAAETTLTPTERVELLHALCAEAAALAAAGADVRP